jgi:flagellar hook-length control protein FliK
MAVATNPLLQLGTAAKAQSTTANTLTKAPQPSSDPSSSFANVYARQGSDAPAKADPVVKSTQDKVAAASDKVSAGDKKEAPAKSAVADSGKKLPVDKADKTDKADKADKAAKADSDDDTTVAAVESQDADPLAVTPVVDPAIASDPLAGLPVVEPAVAALVATPVPAPVAVTEEVPSEDFDPSKDVLADLPAVRLALEHNAKANGTASAHASKTSDTQAQAATDPGTDSSLVNNLAASLEKDKAGSSGEGGDQAFAGLIDDGLKDLKGASGDTRVDDFANRLQNLTQAATAKTANAVPVATPLNQPLSMQQSGWTEGLVNRVMYLSSQNLKSADIQLNPAELGRLDIRVDMTPDQQTQVTFTSAHIGVREALESQQSRLKEMFSQQGMGQLDVNVSDQSRQQAEQQAQQARQTASSGRRGDSSADDVDPVAAAAVQPAAPSVVLGSSAVDYYA